jgi:hypothetical protein
MSEIAATLAAMLFSNTVFNALLLSADALLYFAVLTADRPPLSSPGGMLV